MSRLPFFVFTLLLLCLPSCHRSLREASYSQLEWKDDVYFLEGKPFSGIAREQYKDGKPKGLYPFKDGRFDGLVREWWENGQVSTETNFKNGQRHGNNTYWSKEGKLMKEQVYDHDHSVSVKHYDVK